jgi:hypothetical protein
MGVILQTKEMDLIQQKHHSKSWKDKHNQTINRAELAGITASFINE